jgi:signal transduction histidine kinase
MSSRLHHFQSKTSLLLFLVLGFATFAPLDARGEAVDTNRMALEHSDFYLTPPTNGLGCWIWASNTFDGQTCQLWNSFEIPANGVVTNARLVMTVDNEFTLNLDGRELGRGAEWRELFIFDLTQSLAPGKHVLAVKALNSFSVAGMIFGLKVEMADGRSFAIKSDKTWQIVPDGTKRWEKRTEPDPSWPSASIMAPFGGSPWWTVPVNWNRVPVLPPVKIFFWQTGWFQITLLTICSLVILISLRLMAQLALHQKERWLLQQERARIVREIHDDIGARMTQLVLHGEVAQNELPPGSETRQKLIQICDDARSLLSTMDEILWAVNPRRDTLRDFAAYVCNYAEEFLKPTSIQCLFEVDAEMSPAAFNLPLRRSLLMAIKETLNNAVKHSGATELRLKLHWPGQRLVMVVQDNGKGFDPAVVNLERNGLTNMNQRMQELGGSCQVTSRPGQGCRVEFNVPLKHPRRSLWAWILNPQPFWHPKDKAGSVQTSERPESYDPTKC